MNMMHDDYNSMPFTRSAAEANKDISIRQRQRAAERGHVCLYPLSTELFLDIDSLEGLGRMHAALAQNSYIKSIVNGAPLVKTSPSGKAGRFHVIVFLNKDVDKFERITLQCLLGSDLAREILSYQEAQAGCEQPTVFFEKAPVAQFSGIATVTAPSAPAAPAVPSPDDDTPARPREPEQRGTYMGGRY